ncbi:hypothetical protein J2T13_002634 [Paenibacillus sp. DS2015]|uniref:hypothetical protein n=1 Tax=Paenibacillus sp. DS2015 TaxID=3373917 RepID=UPI003D2431DA
MKKRKLLYITTGGTLALLISLFVTIWCPWINEDVAQAKAISHFHKSWENSADGCYMDCEDCGVISVRKISFGQLVTLQYQCGWEGDVISLKTNDVFINFLGKSKFEDESEPGL